MPMLYIKYEATARMALREAYIIAMHGLTPAHFTTTRHVYIPSCIMPWELQESAYKQALAPVTCILLIIPNAFDILFSSQIKRYAYSEATPGHKRFERAMRVYHDSACFGKSKKKRS
jgi:hypothetical protein